MNLCCDGHEEVCFEGRKCPCCEVLAQLKAAEEQIEQVKAACEERICRAEDEFEGLAKAQLAVYKAEFGPDWIDKLK